MEQKQRRYRQWLSFALGTAHGRLHDILESYEGDAEAAFHDARADCLPSQNKREEGLNEQLHKKASEAYIDKCLAYLSRHHIQMILLEDENYPALLREIHRPPMCLYVKGKLPCQLPLPIAMIGSRKCSEHGREIALHLSRDLAAANACVVSGLANGIDGICAQGALQTAENPFPTIAVLGSGVDVVYPKRNQRIYDAIVERGAVVSEYLPSEPAIPAYFPQRNRIISGISRGVVVIEAELQSGTSITVDFALEQGRDVFAVPGRPTDPKSKGTNRLIQMGCAKPVMEAADILDEYGIQVKKTILQEKRIDESSLSFQQQLILRLLQASERNYDELSEMTGFSPLELNFALTEMELSEIIKQSSGRLYSLK